MADLRRGNGGGSPPDDGGPHRDDLPDFPAEWGTVVIPDDPAELAEEADALRRELRRTARRRRSRGALVRRLGRPPGEPAGVGLPLAIMGAAILTTLVSLFLVTWDRRPPPPHPTTTASSARITEYALSSSSGEPMPLSGLVPAVILLVDGCECTSLIVNTARAVPGGVRVVPVARAAPVVAAAPANVVALADPNGLLRVRFAATAVPTSGAATALLVRAGGTIVATVPGVRVVSDLGDLTRLTG
jgi:hypothetical protein